MSLMIVLVVFFSFFLLFVYSQQTLIESRMSSDPTDEITHIIYDVKIILFFLGMAEHGTYKRNCGRVS